MRSLVLVLLAAGCSHHATAHEERPPSPAPAAPVPDPLRQDLEVFCGPDAAAKTGSLVELGPFVEPHLHETQVHSSLLALRDGRITIDQFAIQIREAMGRAGVTECLTLDKLMSPRP